MRNLLIIASVVLLLAATPAMAEVIQPNDDAKIRDGIHADTSYPNSSLTLGNQYTGLGTFTYKVYIRFDLSSLAADVDTVTFYLNENSNNMGESDIQVVDVYGLNDGTTGETTWSQDTITWNNAPSNVTTSRTDFNNATSLGSFNIADPIGWYSLTSAALADFMNADTNDAITLMFSTATTGMYSSNISMESTVHAKRPYLDVTLVPEPGSIVLLGIGGLSLAAYALRRRRKRR